MDGIEKQERKQEARRRLAAQRNRAGRLRRRVVAASLICFVLLWGVVFAQMVSGNDPVLGDKARTVAQTESRPASHLQASPSAAATEAIETTEPDEVESQLATPTPVEEEAPVELEPEVAPEPEPEPLTTSQS